MEARKAQTLTALSTLGIAVFTAAAAIFVVMELRELRFQNTVLERTLKQTYRPLGLVKFSHADLEVRELLVGPSDRIDRFGLGYTLRLKNKGEGLMLYIGTFSYASPVKMDFRQALLEGQIDTLQFDGRYEYKRRDPILVDQEVVTDKIFLSLPVSDILYVYSLYLYEDLDGTLYDTEHLDVLRFKIPSAMDSIPVPKFISQGSVSVDRFHTYTSEERERLVNCIQKQGHSLADVLNVK